MCRGFCICDQSANYNLPSPIANLHQGIVCESKDSSCMLAFCCVQLQATTNHIWQGCLAMEAWQSVRSLCLHKDWFQPACTETCQLCALSSLPRKTDPQGTIYALAWDDSTDFCTNPRVDAYTRVESLQGLLRHTEGKRRKHTSPQVPNRGMVSMQPAAVLLRCLVNNDTLVRQSEAIQARVKWSP